MVLEKLRDSFGQNNDVLDPAMFYSWEFALRFELSCSGTYVQMFTQALHRCLTIFRHTFRNSNEVFVLLRLWKYPDCRSRYKKNLRDLLECGFKLPRNYEKEIIQHVEPEDESTDVKPDFWHEHLYLLPIDIHDQNALAIIWAALSSDIGIKPNAELSGHFIDFKKKLIMHPYDDRGMDIVATEKEQLSEIYQTFNNWLLDYDLKKMQSTFE